MNDLPPINWVINLAKSAGKGVREAFYQKKEATFKLSSSDLLTETDIAIESLLLGKIQEKYPDHQFLCEESSTQASFLTDAPTWVIDPIDGTSNFVHGLPFVAISIGFTINKVPMLGVIYNPIMDELFYAIHGGGAFMMGPGSSDPVSIHVSEPRKTNHSLIAIGFCAGLIHRSSEEETRIHMSDAEIAHCAELKEITMKNVRNLLEGVRDLRRLGSCATELAFIAAGRLDGMCELCVKEWDLCAGVLIVQEAGGAVTDYDGNPLADLGKRQVIAGSSMELCQNISQLCIAPTFNAREMEK